MERWSAALVYDIAQLLHVRAPTNPWWLGRWTLNPMPAQFASELQGMCPLDHPQ
jgi:hypothetical protein